MYSTLQHDPLTGPTKMEELQLWCCAEGDRTYFKVSIISSQDIDALKVKIYNTAPNFFTGCDPKDLTLTKVQYITVSMRTSM
jgi:hypothetical protein